MIALNLAMAEDAPDIHAMQVLAFMPLYERYHDAETSPATESVQRVLARIADPARRYFYIDADEKHVGAICVRQEKEACIISPVFILPEFQGQGFAQQAIRLAEAQFPQAKVWKLTTILQEKGNCHLYEKMGYIRTGESNPINDSMTLIGYIKHIDD